MMRRWDFLDELRLNVDRIQRTVESLADARMAVEWHADFSPDGSDQEWPEYCGINGREAILH